ncbi:MAG: sodium:solute symporter family protein [Marinilabiliales bacterium]|nr:sodium:solute symporter family protein [Marinilabiliales bacterium]
MKIAILLLYALGLILTGIYSSRRIVSASDYLVAGKRGGVWQITGSLIATILGSTAILGSSDLAYKQGWAAAWMLLCAAIGLFALVWVAPLVRRYGKFTLPQLIADFYGKEAGTIASLIIPVAWIGVIAAQVIGGARVMNSFLGYDYATSVLVIGLLFIFYTIIGGQISVIKTDLIQAFIIIGGIGVIVAYLFSMDQQPTESVKIPEFPFNPTFGPLDLMVLLISYSSTFLVGPDIYTRLFCARNEKVAKTSVLLTALILIPFAFMITYLGIFSSQSTPDFDFHQGSSLISTLDHILPEWGVGLLVAAILSAVMSTAATTLLTSSVILTGLFQEDLESGSSLRLTKLIILVLGLASIFLSLWVTSIVQSMLIALTFFSGAFILPVFAGLLGYRTGKKRSISAMLTGGIVALSGKLLTIHGSFILGNMLIISAFILNGLLLFSDRKWLKNR